MANPPSEKSIHTVVLDTGSIIKNEPSVSTLLSQAEAIVTVPAIIAEIKDAATRSRFETTLKPFVALRSPRPASLQFVTEFARKTGDLAVLSRPDIQIIALTYELECERNGGDWRLRRTPGQKGMNGPPPKKDDSVETATSDQQASAEDAPTVNPDANEQAVQSSDANNDLDATVDTHEESLPTDVVSESLESEVKDSNAADSDQINKLVPEIDSLQVNESLDDDSKAIPAQMDQENVSIPHEIDQESDPDSDSDGWITPSNLKKKQAADASGATKQTEEPRVMQVAVVTTDFAMQNVILQMNLNLISPTMFRVKRLNTYVLRCHACFNVCKDLGKQFCPRCGQATLTRVACSTSASGEFKLHLKKNMQWNHRGDRYSVPKPVHGSSNGRIKGGGKGGWGNDLILAEDQKEYQNATREQKRQKERNLMDEDYLPSILTGDRGKSGGRIKVGAGRNVNSKKR